VRHDMVPFENLQRLDRRRTPRGHSGKCGTGCEFSVVAQDLVARGDSAQRCNAAGQVLSVHEDVGYDVIVVYAPHPARAAESGQNFVRDHQPVVLVTDVANSTQKAR